MAFLKISGRHAGGAGRAGARSPGPGSRCARWPSSRRCAQVGTWWPGAAARPDAPHLRPCAAVDAGVSTNDHGGHRRRRRASVRTTWPDTAVRYRPRLPRARWDAQNPPAHTTGGAPTASAVHLDGPPRLRSSLATSVIEVPRSVTWRSDSHEFLCRTHCMIAMAYIN